MGLFVVIMLDSSLYSSSLISKSVQVFSESSRPSTSSLLLHRFATTRSVKDMDRQPGELQFLGSFGIYRESYKILVSSKKIFTQIALTLILPLVFLSLLHIQLSDQLVSKIFNNIILLSAPISDGGLTTDQIVNNILSQCSLLLLLGSVYSLIVIVFHLLSTSAIVYTIACLYTAREITVKNILRVVPKISMRIMITFLWTFLFLVGYSTATVIFIVLLIILAPTVVIEVVLLVIVFILYLLGIAYIYVIWQLAAVISALENTYGIESMKKGRKLIKGKLCTAGFIFVSIQLASTAIGFVYGISRVHRYSSTVIAKVGYGILFLLLLTLLLLLSMIIQTVLYFVCKSYHHENIDKSYLSDHLLVYDSEYVPLNAKTIQLEEYSV